MFSDVPTIVSIIFHLEKKQWIRNRDLKYICRHFCNHTSFIKRLNTTPCDEEPLYHCPAGTIEHLHDLCLVWSP